MAEWALAGLEVPKIESPIAASEALHRAEIAYRNEHSRRIDARCQVRASEDPGEPGVKLVQRVISSSPASPLESVNCVIRLNWVGMMALPRATVKWRD